MYYALVNCMTRPYYPDMVSHCIDVHQQFVYIDAPLSHFND